MLKEIKEKLEELSAYLQGAHHATENETAGMVLHEARHSVLDIISDVKQLDVAIKKSSFAEHFDE